VYGRLRNGFYGLETMLVLLMFLALLREPRAEDATRVPPDVTHAGQIWPRFGGSLIHQAQQGDGHVFGSRKCLPVPLENRIGR